MIDDVPSEYFSDGELPRMAAQSLPATTRKGAETARCVCRTKNSARYMPGRSDFGTIPENTHGAVAVLAIVVLMDVLTFTMSMAVGIDGVAVKRVMSKPSESSTIVSS